jgi:cellulose synthase/poly-beta-1,6-N-acetylglucosamine synthase-like glycosyltransferase
MSLAALDRQDYPGVWRVICVNDRSTDSTTRLLEEFCAPRPHFEVLHVPKDAPSVASPKKRALELAFSRATGEILMTVDADCEPPDGWIRSMASNFQPGTDIVQGPKRILGQARAIHAVQRLETLGFTLVEGAFFTLGNPMLASAPSLAYRRSLYEGVGGFAGIRDRLSGDDDMLVHKMKAQAAGVAYNADAGAQVGTHPVDGWRELFQQRARWASNGTEYENKGYVLLLAGIYAFFVWLALTPLLALAGLPWTIWLLPHGVKVCLDLMALCVGAWKLRSLRAVLAYPLLYPVQVAVVVWAAPAGHFGWYSWKGIKQK